MVTKVKVMMMTIMVNRTVESSTKKTSQLGITGPLLGESTITMYIV